MKITPLFLLAMFILPGIHAQNIDFGKIYFNAQEIHFPKIAIPEEKRTYQYTGSNADTINFNENDAIQLDGFVKDNNGTVEVRSTYGPLHFDYQRTNTRVDPGTKVTYYSISISVKADGRITTKCAMVNHKRYDLEQYLKSFTTSEFTSERAALDELAIDKKAWMAEAKAAFQKFVVTATNYRANLAFGFAGITNKTKLWMPSSTSNVEYDNFLEKCQLTKAVFGSLKYTDSPKDVLNRLAPAISYLDSIPKLYSEDSKGHKKMRYAAYYDLMKIYFYAEDFAKAESYANLLITNDYDGKDGKKMLEDIKEKKVFWEANKISSSHIAVKGETGYSFYNQER